MSDDDTNAQTHLSERGTVTDDQRSRPAVSRRAVVGTLVGVGLAGCIAGSAPGDAGPGGPADHATDEQTTTTPAGDGASTREAWTPADGLPSAASVAETTVVSGLEIPWDLAFAGDDAFFTERELGVRRVDAETLRSDSGLSPKETEFVLTKEDLQKYETIDFSGFLGVTAHPNYPDSPEIFLYHSYDDGEPRNRVIRYNLEREQVTVLVDGIPATGYHHGGRLAFGPDGDLWITTGDANKGELANDPTSLAGSVLRITPDGDPSPRNPSFDVEADPRIVTYGHRNPQSITFTPDGTALVSEHGPSSRDEVQVVDPGSNYGWPVARGGPNDPEYESYAATDAFTPPVVNTGTETTWAPSGATFYTGDAIGAWKHRLLVCGLASQTLWAVTLARSDAGDEPPLGETGVRYDSAWLHDRFTATAHPLYEGEYGRLRHVEQGPNGSLYQLTSNRDGRTTESSPFPKERDDRLVRIDPQ
jgi:glucose/arabinose dehydrogenase